MSESGDYSPGDWKGYDFTSARAEYDVHVGRSYDDAVAASKATKDLIVDKITTTASAVVIFVIDQTGSMGDWPGTIRSKLPYLDNELKEYFGQDYDVIFMAIGDAYNGEKYPLQVRPPARGVEMKKRINELVFEGEGGSQTYETYELAALYALEKIEMPNAAQAIMIFLGDEQCYDVVGKELAKDLVGVELQKALPTPDLFKKLKQKFAVYHIRKPYGSGYKAGGTNRTSDLDERITNAWAALIGHDHIAPLPDPNRVVDVAFGIFAKEAGRIAYFENELEDRQLKDKGGDKKVEIVYKSLRTIHNVADAARAVAPAHTGKSVMRRSVAPDVKDATPARPAKSLF